MMTQGNFWFALSLTALAGMATLAGSLIAFWVKTTQKSFLSYSLGFSGGAMLYVSFVEILPKAQSSLAGSLSPTASSWLAVGAFFLGIIIIGVIDQFVPAATNPHEARTEATMNVFRHEVQKSTHHPAKTSLARVGLLSTLAITLHNFPEGLVTFVSALENPTLGITMAIAIALHNIPEGISISVPIYFATGSRARAFWISALSGLAEPLGALFGYVFLSGLLTGELKGMIFGIVAGIMVYISLDELLPTAREYGKGHQVMIGLVLGMALMAMSLLLFKAA